VSAATAAVRQEYERAVVGWWTGGTGDRDVGARHKNGFREAKRREWFARRADAVAASQRQNWGLDRDKLIFKWKNYWYQLLRIRRNYVQRGASRGCQHTRRVRVCWQIGDAPGCSAPRGDRHEQIGASNRGPHHLRKRSAKGPEALPTCCPQPTATSPCNIGHQGRGCRLARGDSKVCHYQAHPGTGPRDPSCAPCAPLPSAWLCDVACWRFICGRLRRPDWSHALTDRALCFAPVVPCRCHPRATVDRRDHDRAGWGGGPRGEGGAHQSTPYSSGSANHVGVREPRGDDIMAQTGWVGWFFHIYRRNHDMIIILSHPRFQCVWAICPSYWAESAVSYNENAL